MSYKQVLFSNCSHYLLFIFTILIGLGCSTPNPSGIYVEFLGKSEKEVADVISKDWGEPYRSTDYKKIL